MKDSNLNPMAASPEKPDETLKLSRRELLQFRHDLKGGPLQHMLGIAGLLRLQPADERLAADFPEAISKAVERATEMIDDLVDRAIHRDAPAPWQKLDLTELAREVAGSIPWESHGRRLSLRADERVRPIEGRRNRLRGMMENQLGNALKYSPPGSPIELTVRNRGAHEVEIRVADEGEGVPPEAREAIFKDGYRLPHHQDNAPGEGLGLAFCREVAEEHGGRIWVESNTPRGSVFVVVLPGLPKNLMNKA